MYQSGYKYRLVRDQILHKTHPEFDHVTNRYLHPDRYIKMISYFLNRPTIYAAAVSHE
jgi:hypothetical protein